MESDEKYLTNHILLDNIKNLDPKYKITSQLNIVDYVKISKDDKIIMDERIYEQRIEVVNKLLYPIQKIIIDKIKQHDELLICTNQNTGKNVGYAIASLDYIDTTLEETQVLVLVNKKKFINIDKHLNDELNNCDIIKEIYKNLNIKIGIAIYSSNDITIFDNDGKVITKPHILFCDSSFCDIINLNDFKNIKLLIINYDDHYLNRYRQLIENLNQIIFNQGRIFKKCIFNNVILKSLIKNLSNFLPNIKSIVNYQHHSIINNETIFFGDIKIKKTFVKKLFSKYKKVVFNDLFDGSIDHIDFRGIEEINFGKDFNQSIDNVNMPDIKKIYFGKEFNQTIDKLPFGIEHIIFDKKSSIFNKPIDYLPDSLKSIRFGKLFNQSIDYLPSSLKQIELGYNFNQPIDYLPFGLENLKLGNSFNQSINNLPGKLNFLLLGKAFNQSIDNLPDGITNLIITKIFNYQINKLSKSIQIIQTSFNNKQEKYNTPAKIIKFVKEYNDRIYKIKPMIFNKLIFM